MLEGVERYQLYGDGVDTYSPDLVHIETIAARAPLHNWTIAPHRHPAIVQMIYLRTGDAVLQAEGEQVTIAPRSLVLIPCDAPHAFRFGNEPDGLVLSVADALRLGPRLVFAEKISFLARNEIAVLPLAGSPAVDTMVKALLHDIARRQIDARIEVTHAVTAALSLLLSLCEEAAGLAEPTGRAVADYRVPLFRRFMQLVEENYRSSAGLDWYLGELRCSSATLSRACRAVTARSPGRVIIDRRMLEARRALSFTSASIREVADELGYGDVAYFSRLFHAHVGVPPSDFRRRHTLQVGPRTARRR